MLRPLMLTLFLDFAISSQLVICHVKGLRLYAEHYFVFALTVGLTCRWNEWYRAIDCVAVLICEAMLSVSRFSHLHLKSLCVRLCEMLSLDRRRN